MRITAYFFGGPGDPLDKACHAIFKARNAQFIGCGTMLVGNGSGERDVEYDVADEDAEEVRTTLKKAGFRLEPTPMGPLDLEGVEGIPAQTIVHSSDCALHNGPAFPPQLCDCQPNDPNVR